MQMKELNSGDVFRFEGIDSPWHYQLQGFYFLCEVGACLYRRCCEDMTFCTLEYTTDLNIDDFEVERIPLLGYVAK